LHIAGVGFIFTVLGLWKLHIIFIKKEMVAVARRRSRSYVVPDAKQSMQYFKANVMSKEGFNVNVNEPDTVKYEVARAMGIPLNPIYNGKIQAVSAGEIGGRIGGTMVREMVRMAQQSLVDQGGQTR
jgi:small acid-soluble spore protein D (minor alpha/beta-type SASP)